MSIIIGDTSFISVIIINLPPAECRANTVDDDVIVVDVVVVVYFALGVVIVFVVEGKLIEKNRGTK